MLKNALETEKQLEQLRKEIIDMKKLKVKLMNQLREESLKSKQEEQKRMREIAILKRDHLKKDNQIKSLEAEKKCREIVLKRKQEQIQALRKNNVIRHGLSEKASGRANSTSSTGGGHYYDNHHHHDVANPTNGHNIINKSTTTTTVLTSTTTSYNRPKLSASYESSYMNKRKLAYQHKWQKFDETVIFLFNTNQINIV